LDSVADFMSRRRCGWGPLFRVACLTEKRVVCSALSRREGG